MRGACDDRQRWLARLADPVESEVLTEAERAAIEAHLASCEPCRAALADQRFVAQALRARPALEPSPAFAARLAARLDDASGWLGLLDWRLWTFRLAPVALALFLVAVLSGASSTTTSETNEPTVATLDTWTRSVNESTPAAAVWQDRTSSDALLETMLLGAATARENGDVR